YGVLTLVRRSADGHFKVADLALLEELGEQMALAIRVDRTFRRRAGTADALHAIRVLARRHDDPAEVLALANEIVLAEVGGIDGGFVTANIAHLSWEGNK